MAVVRLIHIYIFIFILFNKLCTFRLVNTESATYVDLNGLVVDGINFSIYTNIAFRCLVCIQRVSPESKYRVPFAVGKETKCGSVRSVLAVKPFKQDLTVCVDVLPNLGPQNFNANNLLDQTLQARGQSCLMNMCLSGMFERSLTIPGLLGQLNLQNSRIFHMPHISYSNTCYNPWFSCNYMGNQTVFETGNVQSRICNVNEVMHYYSQIPVSITRRVSETFKWNNTCNLNNSIPIKHTHGKLAPSIPSEFLKFGILNDCEVN